MIEDTETSDYTETIWMSQILPLQNLDEVVRQRSLPAMQPYERPYWKPNGYLELVDLAPAKSASYITKGLERIGGKTTDHLISLAVPQCDRDAALANIPATSLEGKMIPIPDNHRRRYSVDCLVYSLGNEHLASEGDIQTPYYDKSDKYRK